MQGCKQEHMNVRKQGCKDARVKVSTHEYNDTRMQGCEDASKCKGT